MRRLSLALAIAGLTLAGAVGSARADGPPQQKPLPTELELAIDRIEKSIPSARKNQPSDGYL